MALVLEVHSLISDNQPFIKSETRFVFAFIVSAMYD